MLDEALFTFGLSLPHSLKVKGQTCKRVLRAVAARRLPVAVACKPKWGFSIPLDTWAGADFNVRLKDALIGPSARLSEFFRPDAYRSILEQVCSTAVHPIILRQQVYPRAMMLLAVQLALCSRSEM
jgi:asparagine synthase (glutamine-hydrolysing)